MEMMFFQLSSITSDDSGIYLSWDTPDCQETLRNYVVKLTNCRELHNRHAEPREFDIDDNNSIRIPSNLLQPSNNLFSVEALDVDGDCCATSNYLQTDAQPEGS